MARKVIHIDMDCFYAAIEIRDNPELCNKPVAVGGDQKSRGVLCTCNYLAREYGLHSAMSTSKAFKLCPNLVLLPVRMSYYAEISRKIKMIFNEYSPFVELLSLDEAFLDVSDSKYFNGSATLIADDIRKKIKTRLNLTASAGVAPNKFLAKVASDWNKPDGIFVIAPDEIEVFMKDLPVSKIFGVGKVTKLKLAKMGISTCGELQNVHLKDLIEKFGKFGCSLYYLSRGIDNRSVEAKRIRKSVSVEKTFIDDILNIKDCYRELELLFSELQKRMEKYQNRIIHKLILKIKFCDFQLTTMERINNKVDFSKYIDLLEKSKKKIVKSIRLMGIGVKFKETDNASKQLDLLD